jgi:hypothetical protein
MPSRAVRADKKKPKWQQEFLAWAKGLHDAALLAETLGAAGGDDYDGCFTSRGAWQYEALTEELLARLVKSGYLDATGLQEFRDQT